MVKMLPQCIDSVVFILIAVIVLRNYFNPQANQVYKKKIILAGCVFMILYSVIKLGVTYYNYIESRLPSKESIEKKIQNSGQIVSEDFVFTSKDGYQVLIPSGYTYITSQPGGLSLIATMDSSAFVIGLMQDSTSLESIMDKTLVTMQKKNSTYRIDDRYKMIINETEGIRAECSVIKNNIPAKQIIVLCKKGHILFHLMFSCPEGSFKDLKRQYERIIKSFKINKNIESLK